MGNKRFHLLGLVHLPSSRSYLSCAFTQKNCKLARMLCSLGHEVFFYGARTRTGQPLEEYVNSDKFHFIETHTAEEIAKEWGDGDNRWEIGYDESKEGYRHDLSGQTRPLTEKFRKFCIEHINKIKKPDDFLLITQGYYHKPIDDGVKLFLSCEPGIGYRGSYCRFKAFESSYMQNFTYGSFYPFQSINGHYYDRVIPNYFDEDEVEFNAHKEDYFLYIGRMIVRKGIMTAYKACEAVGEKLVLAGQGGNLLADGSLKCQDFTLPKGNWEYVGTVDMEGRKKLMGRARAVFVPTEYLEPFAGTHIESMLHGTPVITTNFGVFPETVPDNLNGKVGVRCNTLNDFVFATTKIKAMQPEFIRSYAERFLSDNVKYEYDRWFNDLYNLYESTIDNAKKGWHRIE